MVTSGKAIIVVLIAAFTALATGLTSELNGIPTLSAAEWISAAIAFLAAFVALWAVLNKLRWGSWRLCL